MPVARIKLSLKELLYEKETYEILEDTAMHLYNDFSMGQLEGAVLGGGEYCPGIENNELVSKARMRLDGWDKRKPFLNSENRVSIMQMNYFYHSPVTGEAGAHHFSGRIWLEYFLMMSFLWTLVFSEKSICLNWKSWGYLTE